MSTDLRTCPDEELFVRLQQGSLPDDARAQLMAHIDACPACSELLSMLTELERPDSFHSEELLPHKPLMIGRYEVITQAGVGGVGVVYKTRDTRLDRLVAVKLLRPDLLATQPEHAHEATQRLQREARTLAGLDHPHIITIYDVDTHQDQLFTACAFIEGDNLRGWLGSTHREWTEVVTLCLQIARALAAAHAVGIVHRDVKPENVLVRPDDHALLTDFGMATLPLTSSSLNLHTHDLTTQQGSILGTPAYMSPEQLDGQSALPASDQFSFCVMLYEALYGFRPYHAADYQELLRVLKQGSPAQPSSSSIPDALFALLEQGLRPRPGERHQDMAALATHLEAILARDSAAPGSSRMWIVAAASVLALSVITFVTGSFWSSTPPQERPVQTRVQVNPAPTPSIQPDTQAPTVEPKLNEPELDSTLIELDMNTAEPKPVKVASLTTSPPRARPPRRATPRAKTPPHKPSVSAPSTPPTTQDIPQAVLNTFESRRAFQLAVISYDGKACQKHYDNVVAIMPDWEFAKPDNLFKLRCEYLQGTCSHARRFEVLLPAQLVPTNKADIKRHNLMYAHPSCLTSTSDQILAAAHHTIYHCAMSNTSKRCSRAADRFNSLATTHPDDPALEDRIAQAARRTSTSQ